MGRSARGSGALHAVLGCVATLSHLNTHCFCAGVNHILILWVNQAWIAPGTLHTDGVATYRIPALHDVPQEMNVTLVQGARNDREGNVFSSKGVGEASMACGTCPFFAVRDAITAARLGNGMGPKEAAEFVLDSPATPERLRLCCGDRYVKLATGVSTARPVASL